MLAREWSSDWGAGLNYIVIQPAYKDLLSVKTTLYI